MNRDSVFLADDAATVRLGTALAQVFAAASGGVLYLEGDLGAGKTSLARAVLRAFGAVGAVRSPTYTLLEPYDLPGRRVLHMDLYRLAAPQELQQLGLEDDPPSSALWLVEWPQRGGDLLPPADLRVVLARQDAGRVAVLQWSAEPNGRHLNERFAAMWPALAQV